MKKKILGHIYLFDTSSPYLGRSVADREFLSALVTYGTFDEYHFFCESERIRDDLQNILASVIRDELIKSRIKLFFLSDLETQLATTAYTVFHATDPMIEKLLQLRATFKTLEPFAITGYTHTLSSRHLAPGLLLMLLNNPGQQDAIICSSKCGRLVLEKAFARINQSFKTAYDKDISFLGSLPHIPLGINLSDYAQVNKATARQKLGFNQEHKIILSIARLTPSSKMDYYPLVDVFAKILKQQPNARLVLAGGLSETKENYLQELQTYSLEQGITDQIILYPNFPSEHKHLLYSAADIFISPSDNLQETFGITIIEALASGLPVIASDWNGYKELIEDGVTGYKIPVTMQKDNPSIEKLSLFSLNPTFIIAQFTAIDQNLMAAKVEKLLINEELRAHMADNAIKAATQYDWQVLIPQYEKLWIQLKKAAIKQYTTPKFKLPFDFYEIFSHYPTEQLAGNSIYKITVKGQSILANQISISINSAIKKHLDFNLLAAILTKLAQSQYDIEKLNKKLTNYNYEQLASHVLWLLKYGAIEPVTIDA